MKGIKLLLGSITMMLLAAVGVIGGGGGLILSYISMPVSIIMMLAGFFADDREKASLEKEDTNRLPLSNQEENKEKSNKI